MSDEIRPLFPMKAASKAPSGTVGFDAELQSTQKLFFLDAQPEPDLVQSGMQELCGADEEAPEEN